MLNGGTLKLLADATIHDLEMPDEADALDLNGHTLTICSTAHRNRKGWKGQVIGDESQIVWKGMGFALILR